MKKRKQNIFQIKRKIKEYKIRLENLKSQGFHFSHDIYNDINELEKRITQPFLIYKIWKRKIPITLGIIIFLLIILIIPSLFPQNNEEDTQIIIDFTNSFDGMEISKSRFINGTASIEETSSFNIQNLNIQLKIDNRSEKNATIEVSENKTSTIDWSYFLNISNLNNGIHTLSVICFYNGESNIENITLEIKKPRPLVSISFPENNSIELNGEIKIRGNATAYYNDIQRVEIRFDNGTWIYVGNNSEWYYKWNTLDVSNGPHDIYVKSYDGEKWSKTIIISFSVFNQENWITPDFKGGQKFQFVIRNIQHKMIPGNNYTMYGAHRSKNNPKLSFLPIHSYLEFPNKPDWLSISISNNHFITPRDGKIHYFTFNISITNDAPKGQYSNEFLGWKACYSIIPPLARNCKDDHLMSDIWIYTGKW